MTARALHSRFIATSQPDQRLMRAHLIVEEVGELLDALANRDEIALADGLADLQYVTVGAAIQFDIPLAEVHDEVHRSNMTKHTARCAASNKLGDRGKGAAFSPACVGPVIDRVRRLRDNAVRTPLLDSVGEDEASA